MDFVEHLNSDAGHQTLLSLSVCDLTALCRTCKGARLGATPILYRHVELLFHIIRHKTMMCDQLDNFTDCYRRQRLFCETIVSRPHLALLVRELSWTLDFPALPDKPLPPWQPPVMPDPDDSAPGAVLARWHIKNAGPFQAPTDPFQSARPEQVWRAFSLLDHVTSANLRVRSEIPRVPLPFSSVPVILFPNAHTVKLAGKCNIEFAKRVLSHKPTQLRHLTIDHLRSDKGAFLGWSAIVEGALSNLTSLTFRDTGASSPSEPFDNAEEQAAFRELATVLESVRQSIRHICIGKTFRKHGAVMYSLRSGDTPVSQTNFETLILPTLVTGCWPNLESITLERLRIPQGTHGIPCAVFTRPDLSSPTV